MQKIKPRLNPKEESVLRLTAEGLTMAEVGQQLKMPKATVKYYSDRLRKKLEVNRRHHLVMAGRRYFGE